MSTPGSFLAQLSRFIGIVPVLVALQIMVLHRLGLSWHISAQDALVTHLFVTIAGFATAILVRFYAEARSRMYRVVYILLLSLVVIYLANVLLTELNSGDPAYLTFLEKSLPIRFVYALLVLSCTGTMVWLLQSLTDQKAAETRRSETEQLLKDAELTRLREQLQPHFLFNSLNSINALIGSRPVEARKMTQQLSDFLRGTLRKEDKPVRLSEELDHLSLYLEIEKLRFGERLQVHFLCEPDSLGKIMPPLLLQPIVENAIKFGLYDVTEQVNIRITTKTEADLLVIEISNPFDPDTLSANKGAGFGLQSVQRRLQLLFARPDLLQTRTADKIFFTTLRIPPL